MKHVNILLVSLLVSSCALAEVGNNKHYETYTSKVTSCIQAENTKKPILSSDFKGISKSSLITAILYLKEKRIVDCSSRDELYSLTQTLKESNGKTDYQLLEDRYLSFSLSTKESSFLDIKKEDRKVIIEKSDGKNLEINLLDFFDSI